MEQTSDFEKLSLAFGEIKSAFGSLDNLLEAFGLLHMPTAQRYGILFGCLTFVVTVSTVVCLLAFGGSFERIAEQERDDATIPQAHTARAERALLLERLLDARARMLEYYPPPAKVKSGFSNLTKLLLNVHPKVVGEKDAREFPEGYQSNYEVAYRRCQDMPGGKFSMS